MKVCERELDVSVGSGYRLVQKDIFREAREKGNQRLTEHYFIWFVLLLLTSYVQYW
jgi:hypothetical protein